MKPCYRKSSESLCPSGVQKARAEDRGWVVVVQGYELDGRKSRGHSQQSGDVSLNEGTRRAAGPGQSGAATCKAGISGTIL